MRNHGTGPKARMLLLRERILAMKEIWAKDQAGFHGRYVNFDPIFCRPKPVQKPHPPILVGGNGPKAEIARRITELERRGAAAGRGHVPVSVYAVPREREVVARLADAGVDQVLSDLPTLPSKETTRILDELAGLAGSFAG